MFHLSILFWFSFGNFLFYTLQSDNLLLPPFTPFHAFNFRFSCQPYMGNKTNIQLYIFTTLKCVTALSRHVDELPKGADIRNLFVALRARTFVLLSFLSQELIPVVNQIALERTTSKGHQRKLYLDKILSRKVNQSITLLRSHKYKILHITEARFP